jgi:hypothetical protein
VAKWQAGGTNVFSLATASMMWRLPFLMPKMMAQRVTRILAAAPVVPVEGFIFLEHRLLSRTPLGIV